MTRFLFLLCLLVLSSGCATGPSAQDPWEGMNRKIYAFNDAVDTAVIAPAAKVYRKILPSPARTGISNFFRNLGVIDRHGLQ